MNIFVMMLVLILVATFLALLVPIIRGMKIERRIKDICMWKGYRYYGENIPDAHFLFQGTGMDRGDRHRAQYGIGRRIEGLDIRFFDWEVIHEDDENQWSEYFKVAAIHKQFNFYGYIHVRREGMLDKFDTIFGSNDLDFENKAFSDRFFVRANPERFGYDFFHPRMMEVFLEFPDVNVIVTGRSIVIFQRGSFAQRGTLLRIFEGEKPIQTWIDGTTYMLVKIHKNIPKIMLPHKGPLIQGDARRPQPESR